MNDERRDTKMRASNFDEDQKYSAVWLSVTFFYRRIFLSLNTIRNNCEFTTNLGGEYLFTVYFFKKIIEIYLSFKRFILI